MATERSIAKDFHDLMKNIKSFSDGQASVSKWDDENLGVFEVTISPNDGLYKEGEFVFEINMEEYDDLPKVYCKTAIYHPNIDTIQDPDGEICINLFDVDMWTSDCSLQDIVQGLLFLMYNPNLEDPLCSAVSCSMTMEEFGRNVEKSIAGGRVENYVFPVNARYARLHPPMEKEEEKEKGDEKQERVNGEVRKDGQENGQKDGLKVEVKDVDDGEQTGADGYKEDMEKKTERVLQLEARYFGIQEVMSEPPSSDEEDDGDDDNENDTSEEEDEVECDDVSNISTDALDIDYDSDVVNDEDLFDLIDEIENQDALVDDENRKNLNGFESVVSWSKMVYGAENRTFVDNLKLLIEDRSTGPINSNPSQGACKEGGNVAGQTSTRALQKVQRPTVASRFYHALQTRAFRRWLV